MRKFGRVFRLITGSLVSLVSLVFAVLEATLLVTLDFTLYENEGISFVQLLMRLLVAVAALVIGVRSITKSTRSFLREGICLLVASAVMIPFVSNGFGIYFTIISALFLLSQGLGRRI